MTVIWPTANQSHETFEAESFGPSLARLHLDSGFFSRITVRTSRRVVVREKTGMTSIDGVDGSPTAILRWTLGALPGLCVDRQFLIDHLHQGPQVDMFPLNFDVELFRCSVKTSRTIHRVPFLLF